jgi:hypothetical protein
MRELIFEILLRLLKPLLATILGAAFWLVFVGFLGAEATPATFLLCWLAGGMLLLLTQEGPI